MYLALSEILAAYELITDKAAILDMLEFIRMADFLDSPQHYQALFVKRDADDFVVEVMGYYNAPSWLNRSVILLYNKE
jgi:hypothetical protein